VVVVVWTDVVVGMEVIIPVASMAGVMCEYVYVCE